MAKHQQSSNLATTQIIAKLEQLVNLLEDTTPIMKRIAGLLEKDAEDAFENEWNPSTHEKWVDLDEKTKKQRAKKGHWPAKILQVEGELASRLSSDYGDKFARVGIRSGNADDYAPAMQFGRPDKNIPARPYLQFDGLHPEVKDDILDILDEELQKAIS